MAETLPRHRLAQRMLEGDQGYDLAAAPQHQRQGAVAAHETARLVETHHHRRMTQRFARRRRPRHDIVRQPCEIADMMQRHMQCAGAEPPSGKAMGAKQRIGDRHRLRRGGRIGQNGEEQPVSGLCCQPRQHKLLWHDQNITRTQT